MFYSALVRQAMNIMYEAHRDDVDKGGYPYVFHPFYLATQMEDETSVCVALLHDVVEDHGDMFPFERLAGCGFSTEIMDALRLLTHRPEIPYMDYVRAISENALARRVKIADLQHNLDHRRIDGRIPRKEALYREALTFLMEKEKEQA